MLMRLCVGVIVVSLAAACGTEPDTASPTAEPTGQPVESAPVSPPALIVTERGGFIPEGIEYDTLNGRLLTGSLSEGSVFQISEDGAVTAVVTDPDLISSVGIEADEIRDRLLVANSDRSVFENGGAGQAMLGVYNLTTGARIAMVDLAASIEDASADAVFFANDATVSTDGTVYVTDTRMNLIYAVDTNYNASVLHRFDDFSPNGIVYADGGFLLVAGGSRLWKVPLEDPAGATEVMLPEVVTGQDGAVWVTDERLAIVSNDGNRVVALTSGDEWQTADLAGIAVYEGQATTAAVVGGNVYIVHPHFGDADPPSIERVAFQ